MTKMTRVPLKPDIAPSVQLRERKRLHGSHWKYLPHQGSRECARRMRQIEKARKKAMP